jgi:hypothetical protein
LRAMVKYWRSKAVHIVLYLVPITGDIDIILPVTRARLRAVIKGNSDNIRLTDSIKSCTRLSGICNEKFTESHIIPSHSLD